MKIPIRLLAAGILATLWLQAARAAERVALVIGNNAYVHGTPLKNCVNDARAVAKALEAAGFEVIKAEDAALEEMEKKVLEFKRKAQGAKAAWFHYSGHGAEVSGANYLIPVDAKVEEEFQVRYKTYPLDQLIGAMDGAGAPLKVVVLDCCRDNPFGRGWARNGSNGLAGVADTPSGTIIAFATSPGKVAADGAGENSPFTSALVTALAKPGLEIEQVFIETGRQVKLATNDKQVPWRNSSFYGSFVFFPGGAGAPVVPEPVPGVSPLDGGKVGSTYVARLPGGAEMAFCYCPPGSFTMGSPKVEVRADDEDQVTVRITKGFWLARTETTQGQWRAVMGTDPSEFKGAELPVEQVSWIDAEAFIGRLNAAGGLPAGWKWALPTEAQWEYACRAGTKTVFSFGDTLNSRQANFSDSSLNKTVAVGNYAANAWGLYDMHGNVDEWCADWYAKELAGGADPVGAGRGVNRVFRGGSWRYAAFRCRAAYRFSKTPGYSEFILGFRPGLVPSR